MAFGCGVHDDESVMFRRGVEVGICRFRVCKARV